MVFFFYGDNSYEIAQAVSKIKNRYQEQTGGLLDVEVCDMSELPLGELLDALGTQPMFAGSRLMIIRNLGTNTTANQKIADILQLIPKSTVAILIDQEVDRRSTYFRTLSKLNNSKEFVPLDQAKMRNWIKREVERFGGTIDSLAIQKLYERVAHEYRPRDRAAMRAAGADQWQLTEEIKKLIGFNSNITTETIEELVVPNIEQTIFELVDAVTRGHSREALKIYQNISERGVSDQQILAMLNWQYRGIVLAKDNVGSNDYISVFGLNPYTANKAATLGNAMNFEQLQQAYRLMVGADLSIKSGEKPSELAIEQLLYELAQVSV